MWAGSEPGTKPGFTDGEPSISICAYCGTLHKFVEPPEQLRALERDELILAMADPEIRKARAHVILARTLDKQGFTPDQIVGSVQIGAGADSMFFAILRKPRD